MVPMWMFPIALATGNTFVLKPSEKILLSPGSGETAARGGLPDGVFNVVQGDKESVDVLLTDPRVQAVSFVGSTPIAEYIYQTASAHGKRCRALGGAKNHCILMPDADMDMATNAIMGPLTARRVNAAWRFLSCWRWVIKRQMSCARDWKTDCGARVGPGLDQTPENEMGPLISSVHRNKVLGYIDSGESQGASLRVDGRRFSVKGHEQGYFVGPTLFDNVTPEMTIYKEEILDRCFLWCA